MIRAEEQSEIASMYFSKNKILNNLLNDSMSLSLNTHQKTLNQTLSPYLDPPTRPHQCTFYKVLDDSMI
jgi:hypothetical protein